MRGEAVQETVVRREIPDNAPIGFKDDGSDASTASVFGMLLIEPVAPFTEIDQFVPESSRPVLVEHLIYCSSETFRIDVRTALIVVSKETTVVMIGVKRLEILRVV